MTIPPEDALLTLKEACQIYFADAVTTATLRAEHTKGRLVIFKIGRQYFTTLAHLKEMQDQCRAPNQAPGSILTKNGKLGASSMAAASSAQAAAKATFRALRKPSKRT
jgi:hypothetical protein